MIMLPSESNGKVPRRRLRNVMTVDLEDWFHVTNFSRSISRNDWRSCPSRVQHTVPRLLDLFAAHGVTATFFTLGWIARRFPQMIRRIAEAGHELATHGDEHRLLTDLSAKEFRRQLVRSRDAIEQAAGQPVHGHRAPTYSLRGSTAWAIEEMLKTGLKYDSSVFPFGPRRDPRFCDARFPCFLYNHGSGVLVEYPLTTLRVAGANVPVAGGGYFRFLPYAVVWGAIRWLNARGRPAIMYLHPWEIDPHQPRVFQASWLAKFRHYYGLRRTEHKLEKLLSDFRFESIRALFWSREKEVYLLTPEREKDD